MTDKALDPLALRAAKLSRVPGVTIAEACARFEVTKSAVQRARRDPQSAPSLAELALAALTRNGTVKRGSLGDLASIASWIDYINHDGCTPHDVQQLLASCPQLVIDGKRWRLAAPWP